MGYLSISLLENNRLITLLIFIIMGSISCEQYSFDTPEIDPGIEISFQNDIQPMLSGKCIGCHANGKIHPYLEPANAYDALITGGYINISSPEASKLYIKMTKGSGHTAFLNSLQKQTILEWIRQGAKNN